MAVEINRDIAALLGKFAGSCRINWDSNESDMGGIVGMFFSLAVRCGNQLDRNAFSIVLTG